MKAITRTIKEGVSISIGNTDKGPRVSWSTYNQGTQHEHFGESEEATKFFEEKSEELKSYPKRPINPKIVGPFWDGK